jgi:hypothetical protein
MSTCNNSPLKRLLGTNGRGGGKMQQHEDSSSKPCKAGLFVSQTLSGSWAARLIWVALTARNLNVKQS